MALAPLAVTADLSARGIATTDTTGVAAFLAAATAAVRDAAGCPISKETSTVTLSTEASRRLELPSRPVHSVASVTLDGESLTVGTDVFLRGSALWREIPWQRQGAIPGEVVVTFTHGLDAIPEDIVDLVCSLVAGALASKDAGYEAHTGVQYEASDDYRVGYLSGDDAAASVMDLPERTKRSLRKRFGSQVLVAGSSR